MVDNKRIPDTTIEANYYDGQILYGEDVNEIINVFKESINANKNDLDMQLAGYKNAPIKDTYLELSEVYGTHGQYGFVLNGSEFDNGINVYIYTSGNWVFSHKLSMQSLYKMIYDLSNSSQIQISVSMPIDDRVTLWYKVIDETYVPPVNYNILSGGTFDTIAINTLYGGTFDEVPTDLILGGTF